jgi:hypothetical protein
MANFTKRGWESLERADEPPNIPPLHRFVRSYRNFFVATIDKVRPILPTANLCGNRDVIWPVSVTRQTGPVVLRRAILDARQTPGPRPLRSKAKRLGEPIHPSQEREGIAVRAVRECDEEIDVCPELVTTYFFVAIAVCPIIIPT